MRTSASRRAALHKETSFVVVSVVLVGDHRGCLSIHVFVALFVVILLAVCEDNRVAIFHR